MSGAEGTYGPASFSDHYVTCGDMAVERSPGAGRYDGALCHRPAPGEQRGVVPPEDSCITCGDIAVEVRVLRLLDDGMADVDTGEGTERVSVALVSAVVGDTILVHAGEAIAVVGR